MKKFGGSWTEDKLEAFEKYVKAYLKILNKQKSRFNWQIIYFDGFAGFGERIDMLPKQYSLFDLIFNEEDKEEYSIYKGSVERVLSLPEPFRFDWYYFIETNSKYVENLKKLVNKKYKFLEDKIVFREDDCNNQLKKLANLQKKNKKYRSLILLDPFGLQVKWNSIKQLKGTKSDIWILLPSGVAINRMLPRNGVIKHKDILEDIFGKTIEELKNIFYSEYRQRTIFNEIEKKMVKKPDAINKIVEVYVEQLRSIWQFVTNEPLVLFNSKNVPIFHFIFASNNENGFKIASQIIGKRR